MRRPGVASMTGDPLDEDITEWSPESQRAWLASTRTQQEMLEFAADELAISYDSASEQPFLTNRDLAAFIVELINMPCGGDANAGSL